MFNCKIYHNISSGTEQGSSVENTSCVAVTLHNQDYKSLRDIANDLGLTYQQVADLSSRKERKKYQDFKFFPKIEINRIKKESDN